MVRILQQMIIDHQLREKFWRGDDILKKTQQNKKTPLCLRDKRVPLITEK